jgi:hemolysin III
MESAMSTVQTVPVKPSLRGVVHHYAFFASLLTGAWLVAVAPTARERWPTAVYVCSLSALLGVSALFHRVTWSVPARRWMARLDHAMIGVLIAGTYTPFGALGRSGVVAAGLVPVVWGGALGSALLHLAWIDAPKPLSAICYILLGWVGIAGAPDLVRSFGWTPLLLLGLGGGAYSIGAMVYAWQRPNPRPEVFGYHELFHVLVVVGAAFHYAAVALAVVP